MLILTNSNPQSVDIMLCLYKEWHKLQIQIKGIFSQDTTTCIPAFPFDLPTQSDTLMVNPTMNHNYRYHISYGCIIFHLLIFNINY